MEKCFIFGAGEYFGSLPEIPPDCFVIAADGGYSRLAAAGIEPGLIVGDFDSLGYVPASGNVLKFRSEKDKTDTELAIDEGLKRGCREFYIYGGTGGRLDHTLANIQCLARLSKLGLRGFLFGGGFAVTALTDGSIDFDKNHSGYISVFAHGGSACGVDESGFKYRLTNATLSSDAPIGVSNEFTGTNGKVSVKRGTLIVVYQNT